MQHQPRQNKRLIAEWFLCAAFNVTLDGSDDSMYQRLCVLGEPVRVFVSFHCVLCGDFCFAHFSYTISERNDCSFCVVLQRDLTTTKQVNEFRHPFSCLRFSDPLLQRNAAHDVLASVFFHRNAGYCFF